MFMGELEKQREAVFSEALSTLKQSVNQAVATLRNLLNSDNESIRLRASLHFLRLGLKVREEIELEERLMTPLKHRGWLSGCVCGGCGG